MNCPSCGTENRPEARFCAQCGTPLERPVSQASDSRPPAPSPEPLPRAEPAPTDATPVAAKVGLFGGNGLITLGALIVLFAFMLPWASCGNLQLSGLDIVTGSSQYGGDATWTILTLVPLGALALLVMSVAGIAVNLLSKSIPTRLARLAAFLPLLAVVPGLCGCCPSCAFFANVQSARSDPDSLGLGMLVKAEYGFWLTLVGLMISFVGIIVALIAGWVAQRHTTSGAGPPSQPQDRAAPDL